DRPQPEGYSHHHGRAVADRRPAGPPDPRRGQRPDGHGRTDDRAVAALRRRRVFANDWDRAFGRLERRLSPLPLRARRHRRALTAVLPPIVRTAHSYVSEDLAGPATMRPRCRWPAAPSKPSARLWRRP